MYYAVRYELFPSICLWPWMWLRCCLYSFCFEPKFLTEVNFLLPSVWSGLESRRRTPLLGHYDLTLCWPFLLFSLHFAFYLLHANRGVAISLSSYPSHLLSPVIGGRDRHFAMISHQAGPLKAFDVALSTSWRTFCHDSLLRRNSLLASNSEPFLHSRNLLSLSLPASLNRTLTSSRSGSLPALFLARRWARMESMCLLW